MSVPEVPYGPPQPSAVLGAELAEPAVVLPTPSTVARVVPGPRPVPVAYRVATFDLSLAELVVLTFVVTPAVVLAVSVPWLGALVFGAIAATVLAFRVQRYRWRMRLLRWGEVATVTGFDARPTRTSYGNVPLRHAVGWTLSGGAYTGRGYVSDVDYTVGGATGRLRLRGRRYGGGVVLADPREPARAVEVSSFPFDLTPGPDGQWPGTLTGPRWAGVALTLVVEGALVLLALVLAAAVTG